MHVDVLIVGGGIQGLLLLRELTAAGHRCLLVTKGDLGEGQTLHSHGLLNSGTGLVTGEGYSSLEEHVLPYLRRLAVPVYGDDRSYLGLPQPAVEQLRPAWAANRYRPEPVEPHELPGELRSPLGFYRVPGYHVPKRALVAALVAGLQDCVVRGEVARKEGGCYLLDMRPGEELSPVQAEVLIVAAGCGSVPFLERVIGPLPPKSRVSYTKGHMICLRAPVGALPVIGTVATPQLVVVGHLNRDQDTVGSGDYVSWYVTPSVAEPTWYDSAPDDAAAEVEVSVVERGVACLEALFPLLADAGPDVEASVFAGFKQNLDGVMTKRLFALVDESRRVYLALPSVLAQAFANARDAVAALETDRQPTDRPPPAVTTHELSGAIVGKAHELCGHLEWSPWSLLRASAGARLP